MKNPLYKLVTASLRKHLTQNLAALLMMGLSFCFVTAATQMYASLERLQTWETHQRYSAAQAMLLDARPETWDAMQSAFPLKAAGEVLAVAAHDLGADYNHLKITLGALDETALQMSGFTLISGTWPQAADEIALSETGLMRLGTNTQVGETLPLILQPFQEEAGTRAAKSYRLSGIFQENTGEWVNNLQNGYYYSSDMTAFTFNDLPVLTTIPTALVPYREARTLADASPGAKTSYFVQFADASGNLMSDWGLYNLNEQTIAPLLRGLDTLPYFVRNSVAYPWYERGFILRNQALRLAVGLIMGGLSVLLLGSGIASSFEMRLNERRQQIGLLRAIGASRGQAVSLALLEALALLLPSLLLGAGAGSLLAKICLNRLTSIMMRPFEFSFSVTAVILWGWGICGFFLCLFALRPMMRLTKKSPVALLHLQVSGKAAGRMRAPKRLPKSPLRFLAGRYRRLHRFRHVFPVLVLSACLALTMLAMNIYEKNMVRYGSYETEKEDLITMTWGKTWGNEYPDPGFDLWRLNPQELEGISTVPDQVVEQIRSMPGMASVTAAKYAYSPILFLQPEQVTAYVQHAGIDFYSYAGDENGLQRRKDAARKTGLPGELYPWTPQDLGWPPDSGIAGIDESSLASLKDSLMAGSIDLPAIRSGEAVLLGASSYFERLGYDGSGESGLTDDRDGEYVYNNDAFRVGDTITFGKVYIYVEDGATRWKTVTHTARICGLVNRSPGIVYTTSDSFSAWGFPEGITHMQFRLALGETYGAAFRSLDMLASQYSFRLESRHAGLVSSRRSFEGTVFLYQAIFLLLGSMGMALMVSNTWSRLAVREQELSLLRAVGMDGEKIKRLLYGEAVRDGIWAAVLGTLLGMLACALFNDLAALGQEAAGQKNLAYYLSLLKGVSFGTAAAAFVIFPLTGLAVSFGWIRRLLNAGILSGIRQAE